MASQINSNWFCLLIHRFDCIWFTIKSSVNFLASLSFRILLVVTKFCNFWEYIPGNETQVLLCILLMILVFCTTSILFIFSFVVLLALISTGFAILIMDKATTHTKTFHCRLCNETDRGEKWIAFSLSIQVIRCRLVSMDMISSALSVWFGGSGVWPLTEQRLFTMCLSSDGSRANLPAYPYTAYYSILSIPRPCTVAPGLSSSALRAMNADKRYPRGGLRHTLANRIVLLNFYLTNANIQIILKATKYLGYHFRGNPMIRLSSRVPSLTSLMICWQRSRDMRMFMPTVIISSSVGRPLKLMVEACSPKVASLVKS